MSKPSIAELLNASGHTTYTQPLLMRAMYTLYGNIGANLDERNWLSIMQSSNPLETAEAGLLGMYQDSGYLLRNTSHLVQSGYVAAQAEITYRQMADRLGFTYQHDWSVGTSYESLGQLSMGQLIALVPVAPPPPPLPTISVASSATDFAVSLNVAGTVKMSVSGDLASFAAGTTVLTEQAAIKEGFLTLTANGNNSTATSQYVALGTSGNDTIDTTLAGSRTDYLFGGAGNDTLSAGAGDDAIHGGGGNDTIKGGIGADSLTGGDGDDRFLYEQSDDLFSGSALADLIDGGAGTNALVIGNNVGTQNAFQIYQAMSWSRMTNVSRIEAVGPFEAQYNIVLNDDAYESGLRVVDLSADTSTSGNANFINVSAETGSANSYTLIGSSYNDLITGGAGNDTITGGAGADSLSGGNGDDVFQYTDNRQLREDSAVNGGDGIDTIAFSVAIDTLTSGSTQGDNFHADFTSVTGVERIKLFGANLINLGDVLPGVGITTIATGDDSTTLRYDNIALGTLNIDATALADNKTLTLTQAGPAGAGQWFSVTELKGDVNAAGLQGGIAVTAAMGSGFDVSIVGGNGNDTLTGGAGNDTITGHQGADSIALGAADGAADQVIYTAAGETASGLFTSGGSTAGMDRISEASVGDVIDLWDVFSAAPTIGTAFLSAATVNNAAIVQGTLNTVTGVFTAGADNDYMLQWADGTAVHSIVLKDFGVTAPTLTVNVANDSLTLAPIYNLINGTAGDDTLNGGAGYDMIIGGAGKDTMNGGDGDDVFIIASGADHGNSNNGEKIYGGNGVDVIRFTSTTLNDTLKLSYWIDVEEVRMVAADGSENATAGLGINADWLGVGPNIKLYGNAGNNNLVGNNDGSNTIEGGAGNDTIVGGFRADVLIGGAGNDTINGGAGADSIQFATTLGFGSAGDASAIGGLASAVGVDAVTFVVADDTFQLDETVFGLMGNGASIGAAGGILAAAQFEAVAGAAANLAGTLDTAGNGAAVYDTINNDLYFLEAGAANNTTLAALVAAGTALKIADINLTGVITAADFFIVQ